MAAGHSGLFSTPDAMAFLGVCATVIAGIFRLARPSNNSTREMRETLQKLEEIWKMVFEIHSKVGK